jgi:hypothetical protein
MDLAQARGHARSSPLLFLQPAALQRLRYERTRAAHPLSQSRPEVSSYIRPASKPLDFPPGNCTYQALTLLRIRHLPLPQTPSGCEQSPPYPYRDNRLCAHWSGTGFFRLLPDRQHCKHNSCKAWPLLSAHNPPSVIPLLNRRFSIDDWQFEEKALDP